MTPATTPSDSFDSFALADLPFDKVSFGGVSRSHLGNYQAKVAAYWRNQLLEGVR